jgi:hypothetical protein
MVAAMVGSDEVCIGESLEPVGRFYVGAFSWNMVSVTVNMFYI